MLLTERSGTHKILRSSRRWASGILGVFLAVWAGLLPAAVESAAPGNAATGNWAAEPGRTSEELTEGVWSVVRPPARSAAGLSFLDSQHGWMVHERTIRYTADGGATWIEQTPGSISPGVALLDVDFVDASCGWVSGTYGVMLHTIDGGLTWCLQSPPLNDVYAIDFTDHDNGWALDDGALANSIDGGKTWSSQPIQGGIHELFFLDRLRGLVVGDSFILRTSDGGITWQKTDMHILLGDVSFIDSLNGWLVGNRGTYGTHTMVG